MVSSAGRCEAGACRSDYICQYFFSILRKKKKTHEHSVEGRLGRRSRSHSRTREIDDLCSRCAERLITRFPTHLSTPDPSSRRCRLRRRGRGWRKRRRLRILHLCPYFLFFIFAFVLMFQVLHDGHDAVRVSFLLVLGDAIVVEDLLPFGGHTGVYISRLSVHTIPEKESRTHTFRFGNQIRHG